MNEIRIKLSEEDFQELKSKCILDEAMGSYPSALEKDMIKLIDKYGFKNMAWVFSVLAEDEAKKFTNKGEEFYKDHKTMFNKLEQINDMLYNLAYNYTDID